MSELLAADLSPLVPAVLMIDGLNVASEMIAVALVICADGSKVPVGLRLGDTENTVVVKDLLADLVDRDLRSSMPSLPCWAGPRRCARRSIRFSAPRPWSSGAPCTSAGT